MWDILTNHSPMTPALFTPNNTPIAVASHDISTNSNAKIFLLLPYMAYRRSSRMTIDKPYVSVAEYGGGTILYVPCVVIICTAVFVFCAWKNLVQLSWNQYH